MNTDKSSHPNKVITGIEAHEFEVDKCFLRVRGMKMFFTNSLLSKKFRKYITRTFSISTNGNRFKFLSEDEQKVFDFLCATSSDDEYNRSLLVAKTFDDVAITKVLFPFSNSFVQTILCIPYSLFKRSNNLDDDNYYYTINIHEILKQIGRGPISSSYVSRFILGCVTDNRIEDIIDSESFPSHIDSSKKNLDSIIDLLTDRTDTIHISKEQFFNLNNIGFYTYIVKDFSFFIPIRINSKGLKSLSLTRSSGFIYNMYSICDETIKEVDFSEIQDQVESSWILKNFLAECKSNSCNKIVEYSDPSHIRSERFHKYLNHWRHSHIFYFTDPNNYGSDSIYSCNGSHVFLTTSEEKYYSGEYRFTLYSSYKKHSTYEFLVKAKYYKLALFFIWKYFGSSISNKRQYFLLKDIFHLIGITHVNRRGY